MSEDFRVATPRVAAGALFRDDDGRVLLVKPTYKKGWDIPGGYVEPGESPKAAAVREVKEELGLDVTLGRLLLVDWAPHPDEGDKLLFIFDGGHLDTQTLSTIRLQASELNRIEFVAVDDFTSHLNDRLRVRIVTAVSGTSETYAEHGNGIEVEAGISPAARD